ncbi:MAG: hypothetical protein Crog4KO_33540 [Crocinitomicaceae bacterium]
MLKKFSFFALAALIFVGCSSESEDENEVRKFKDSVFAFVNSNPNLIGFGKIDVKAIMKDGDVEQNSMFQMFASSTYDELKGQLDVTSPIYMAMEVPEDGGGDPTVYLMAKLKNKKKFEENWTSMGYIFKKHKGVSYAEDDEQLIALRNDLLMVVMIPGSYDGKALVSKAFGYVDGKIAPAKLQKKIDAPGDFVMHFDLDRMKDNDPSMAMIPKGIEADISLNFENGKMVFEGSSDDSDRLEKQFDIEVLDNPVIAKKITDAEGNVLMAMQLSVRSSLTDMMNMNDTMLEEGMSRISEDLAAIDPTLTMSDMTREDNIVMPESGKLMGGEAIQIMMDLDALSSKIPEYGTHMKELDYASYEMKDGKIRLVIATHKQNENFLATVLKAVDTFMMSGGLMQMAAMN